MQKIFDLSTGPLSEEFRWNLVIVRAEWLYEGCALTGNLNSVFSPWECGLELRVSYIGFSYYQCISATSRKRIEQLLPQSLEPTLPVQLSKEGGTAFKMRGYGYQKGGYAQRFPY